MEIIFRAIDGKDFTSELECRKYERTILEGVMMWDRRGHITNFTKDAFCVWLEDEKATKAFFALAEKQEDCGIEGLTEEDYGLFIWDECRDKYMWIDSEELNVLTIAKAFIDNREVKKNV